MEGFLIVIVIAFVIWYIKTKTPEFKGLAGERFVTRKLANLDQDSYKTFNNIMLLSDGSTETTQIDQIVVSRYGIFCVETKNYSGWIFGGANQKYWTQVIYHNKEKFYNPLWQNYAHVKAVEKLFKGKYLQMRVYSLVAFPSADKIKVSGTDFVGYASDVVEKIMSFTNVIFSDSEVDDICLTIVSANIEDEKIRKDHDKEVRFLNR
jgi:hypothetical protein